MWSTRLPSQLTNAASRSRHNLWRVIKRRSERHLYLIFSVCLNVLLIGLLLSSPSEKTSGRSGLTGEGEQSSFPSFGRGGEEKGDGNADQLAQAPHPPHLRGPRMTGYESGVFASLEAAKAAFEVPSFISSRNASGNTLSFACPFDEVPVYYINMDGNVARDAYMRDVLRFCPEGNVRRVSATNGTDMKALVSRMALNSFPSEKALKAKEYFETMRLFKALPGQMGNLISHLDAVNAALDAGASHAVILEDDVGFDLVPHWPAASLAGLISWADENEPGWKVIRLQWNDYWPRVEATHAKWRELLASRGSDKDVAVPAALARSGMRQESATPQILAMPHTGGWGNVASLFSRAGMEELIAIHRDASQPARWRCNPEFPCAADLSFWQEMKHVLVATPPLLTYRVSEQQTKEIRHGQLGNSHRKSHMESVARAVMWALEAQDIQRPGGQFLPANLTFGDSP